MVETRSVPPWRRPLIAAALVAGVALAAAAVALWPGLSGGLSPAEQAREAEAFVAEIDLPLPMRLNATTTWLSVEAVGPEVRYAYRLAGPPQGGQALQTVMRDALRAQFCTIDAAADLLGKGIVFRFDYTFAEGGAQEGITITRDDCREL